MRVLLTAPYVGEIGWELLSWQARVRWTFYRGGYDRLVVLGASGKAAFYEDMPLEYRVADLSGLSGAAYEDRRIDLDRRECTTARSIHESLNEQVARATAELSADADVDVLWPGYEGRLWLCTSAQQQFIRFQRTPQNRPATPWVVLVKRQRALAAENNWPEEAWANLQEQLERRGITTSVYPCEAAAAIEALSACDLAVGFSTGGLHLASLCGCPHVVWSAGEQVRWTPWQMTNRQRYETFWNPLGTPVEYHAATQHPAPDQVAQWVVGALERIGRHTGSRVHRCRTQAGWKLRSLVAWRVLSSRMLRRCPWPLQKWVRYGWM